MSGAGRREARRSRSAVRKAEREIARLQANCEHDWDDADGLSRDLVRCRKCRLVAKSDPPEAK